MSLVNYFSSELLFQEPSIESKNVCRMLILSKMTILNLAGNKQFFARSILSSSANFNLLTKMVMRWNSDTNGEFIFKHLSEAGTH